MERRGRLGGMVGGGGGGLQGCARTVTAGEPENGKKRLVAHTKPLAMTPVSLKLNQNQLTQENCSSLGLAHCFSACVHALKSEDQIHLHLCTSPSLVTSLRRHCSPCGLLRPLVHSPAVRVENVDFV